MLKIGCHLSSSKGYEHMAKEAIEIGANTFQFFTRNPRGFSCKKLDLQDVSKYKEISKDKIYKVLAHAPYTLNPCSADSKIRELAIQIMNDDLNILSNIPNSMYNFHPGSHVKQGIEIGTKYTSDLLRNMLEQNFNTEILLETMSGKGSEIGSTFEQIKNIIDMVDNHKLIGVCLDTCHVWDAGYDIANKLDSILDEFDKVIGIERLKAIHLNDSKNELGSRKDRHECIGKGYIGIECFKNIINHQLLKDIPFFLETPQKDIYGYKEEIEMLKKLKQYDS